MSTTTFASDAKTESNIPIQIDEEELKRLNQEMIMSDLITPDKLYLDLILFKDYTVGALLSFLHEMKKTHSNDERFAIYKSLVDGLPEYQTRKFDDVAHYFPKFGVTTEQVKARIRDPEWTRFILHNAPVTPYIATLKSQIAVNVNHSAVKGKRDPIDLTINTYPLKLNTTDRHIVGLYFAQQLNVRVTVVYRDVTKLTLKDVIGYDELYTYFFADTFNHDCIRNAYTELKFIRKRLFVPKIFGEIYNKEMNTEKEEMLVASRLDILTLFTFFPTRLCSAVSPEELDIKK